MDQAYSLKDVRGQQTLIREEFDKLSEYLGRFEKVVAELSQNNAAEKQDDLRIWLGTILSQMEHVEVEVQKTLNTLPPDEVRPAIRERSGSIAERAQEEKFSNFLATIGNSVIESQEALDERSIKYLKKNKDRPFLPPTIFRIPKISASLKVGLKKSETEGLSILIVSRKHEQEVVNEQSINFEIAAVPPSPELLQMLHDQTPRIEFLFEHTERQAVFQSIEEKLKKPNATDSKADEDEQIKAKLKDQLEQIIDEKNRNQVLIWPVKDRKAHIILFAEQVEGEHVCIWFLDQEKEKAILEPIIRLDLKSKAEENQAPLREFIFKLGEAQAKLL